VTTLPAKAGSFRVVRSPWLPQELLRLRLRQPVTLTPEGSIQAHRSRPCRPEGATPLLVFLLSRGEVLNAISTAEHLTGPKPPSTRDMSYPTAFPMEPPKHIVRVKVPSDSGTKRIACQGGRGAAGCAIRLFPCTRIAAVRVGGHSAHGNFSVAHPALLPQSLADGDPHSPPAYRPESPAEVFYGQGDTSHGTHRRREWCESVQNS
jgi:hypothetical protein